MEFFNIDCDNLMAQSLRDKYYFHRWNKLSRKLDDAIAEGDYNKEAKIRKKIGKLNGHF